MILVLFKFQKLISKSGVHKPWEQGLLGNSLFGVAPNISESLECNLPCAIQMAPIILTWLLDFWKFVNVLFNIIDFLNTLYVLSREAAI
jgi:hypothetical protein